MRSPSPGPKTTVHSYNYSSSSTRESKQEVPRSPPPHRSPSPVSFISPPTPNTKTTVKTYNFEQSPRPHSPQPVQKFSPSDPSRTLNYPVSPPQNHTNVYSYQYSTRTTQSSKYPPEDHVPLLPRPFPTPSPTPEQQQQPPKKLDELMASFSDSETQVSKTFYRKSFSRKNSDYNILSFIILTVALSPMPSLILLLSPKDSITLSSLRPGLSCSSP